MTGNGYFYAMEFLDGKTVRELIEHFNRLEPSLAIEIVKQVAAGLVAVEKQNLVHRDIKPSNIMVSLEDGRLQGVKIIDLGLAKPVNQMAETASMSVPGSFAGTPGYASPEQFSGLGADIRSDLYSLGVTLWEMLTGDLPFKGSVPELMYRHQHATLPRVKLTEKPRQARIQSAQTWMDRGDRYCRDWHTTCGGLVFPLPSSSFAKFRSGFSRKEHRGFTV
jgi:serine/threonine-protein kinase